MQPSVLGWAINRVRNRSVSYSLAIANERTKVVTKWRFVSNQVVTLLLHFALILKHACVIHLAHSLLLKSLRPQMFLRSDQVQAWH